MRHTLWEKLVPAMLVGVLLVSGCAKTGTPAAATPAAADQRPALNVPARFDNETAKRDFAMKAVDDGYYRETVKLLEESVAAEPNAGAYARLGIAKYNLGDYQGAVQAWTKAGEMDPKLTAQAQNNMGNALRDAKQLKEAETAYRKALELDPASTATLINLAQLLQEQKRSAEALTLLQNADPSNHKDPSFTAALNSAKAAAQMPAHS